MPAPVEGEIACVTKDGRTLVFNIEEVRLLAKGRGLKLIDASTGQNGAGRHSCPSIDGAVGKLKGERLEICRGNRGGKGKLVRASRK